MDATQNALNQPLPPEGRDPWAADTVLRAAVTARGGDADVLAGYGNWLGRAETVRNAVDARRYAPELRGFDRRGARLDQVGYHEGYHALLAGGLAAGYAALPWEGEPGGHVSHAAMVYMTSQVEPGVCCPMTMTYAGIPVLRAAGADGWAKALMSRSYDPSARLLAEKSGATLGMAMTEKQGGSDLRSNEARAEPDGDTYRLSGHKWFCSAPMSDGFVTLAQTHGGLTCFLVPRWLEGGANALHLMRLKDKLGNRANASAEIEYHGALAHRLGDEGVGVRTILEMVHHTRLDTAIAPAGLMRAALAEAHWWCEGRSAFQRRLIDQPLMRSVLADMALDWEGALALGLRVAAAFDGRDAGFARVAVALAKYLANKRCPVVVAEAMECLGGMGYVEETPMPMLYREAPLNGIWEGSGNVICLDILRTLDRMPDAAAALAEELDAAQRADRRYDAALEAHRDRWPGAVEEREARWFVERLAVLLTASVLIRTAPGAVADGYVATRVAGARGQTLGAVSGLDEAALIGRIGGV